MAEPGNLTSLLNAARGGDGPAADAAYRIVYAELRACAQRQLRHGGAATLLSPTALVNEAYLKLARSDGDAIHNRVHFFALSARAMRQIMVDHARRRGSAKRGGGVRHTDLGAAHGVADGSAERALELDAALRRLETHDPRLCRIVEWHFFAGLGLAEIAHELGETEHAVRRDWELARAFLKCAMDGADP
ncbi:MAG TPA: ECF-type sigma factor [Dokdonella sp.]